MFRLKKYLTPQFLKDLLVSTWLPSTLLLVYVAFTLFLRDVLPSTDEIVHGFTHLFSKFGYEIIFVGAFLEAALIIDFFVPGSSIVLVGAYFASTGLLSYPIFFVVSLAGFTLGYSMDYLLGYYGWSDILTKFGMKGQLDKARARLKRMGGKSFFIGYFHPDLASFFAMAAGVVKMDIKEFLVYNFLAGSVWLLFWTGLVYLFGESIGEAISQNSWIVLLLFPVFAVVVYVINKIK